MIDRDLKNSERKTLQPYVVGTGLLALDVVVNTVDDSEVQYFAGGTCGNVLTILSYLGWKARPISRLKDDYSAKWLLADLRKWGVDTSLISQTADGSTPVIIQTIKETARGARFHSFSLRCPCCGAYLPGYKPVLGTDSTRLARALKQQQVFFFDRVSRGTLSLASHCKELGALIVFEPSGIGEPRLFKEAWSMAHIVKYSHERLRDIADLDLQSASKTCFLEIETLGASGLRYRSRLKNATTRGWKTLEVIRAPSVKDTAGAGDWCTAGIIHKLGRGGLRSFLNAKQDRLAQAIRYGQSLATWNCAFESARGGMYFTSRSQFERQIQQLLKGKSIRLQSNDRTVAADDLRTICPSCESADFAVRKLAVK